GKMAATSGRWMPYGTVATTAPSSSASTRSIGARREKVQPETTSAPLVDECLPGCSSAPKNRSPVASAFARRSSAARSGMDDVPPAEQRAQPFREVSALGGWHLVTRQQQTIAGGGHDARFDRHGRTITGVADDGHRFGVALAVGIREQLDRPSERAL